MFLASRTVGRRDLLLTHFTGYKVLNVSAYDLSMWHDLNWGASPFVTSITNQCPQSVTQQYVEDTGKVGCLFDVLADPEERHDLALQMPTKALELRRKMEAAERLWFNPDRGEPDPRACEVARKTGFWQPFLP